MRPARPEGLGCALMIAIVLLGMGGCSMLSQIGANYRLAAVMGVCK